MTTLRQALFAAVKELEAAGVDTPALDARVLLCHILGRDFSFLLAHGEELLEEEDTNRFFVLVKRRCAREPVAYLTGEKEFLSLSFRVGEGVLIPRPDTEILAQEALRLSREAGGGASMLDLCCGSGCIGISCAVFNPVLKVVLADISPAALNVAAVNTQRHGVEGRTEILCSDLFCGLRGQAFHLIASNPPYITAEEMGELDRDVAEYEPRGALYGGEDGLDFYRAIAQEAPAHLLPGGHLLLEIGAAQGEAVHGLLEKRGFCAVRILKDYGGRDRVVCGQWPGNL